MPEEDDEALGQMLGDRLKSTNEESEQEKLEDTDVRNSETETEPGQSNDTNKETIQNSTGSTKITQSTNTTSEEREVENSLESEDDTVRSRSPFPLYVTPELKKTVQNRFEKFNAQRTLNDEPQVEKHKHFMEGLLHAGLDHPDLEKYVLDEFEDI